MKGSSARGRRPFLRLVQPKLKTALHVSNPCVKHLDATLLHSENAHPL